MIFGLVLLVLCAAGIIASIWMTSKPKPSKQPDQNIPKKSDYRASGDFSALIDAIRDEGETYRREEGKEVPIVVMVHRIQEKHVLSALREIDKLSMVTKKTLMIRIES